MAGEGPVLAGRLLDSREILNNTTCGIQIKYFKTRIYMKYLNVCFTYPLLAMLLLYKLKAPMPEVVQLNYLLKPSLSKMA